MYSEKSVYSILSTQYYRRRFNRVMRGEGINSSELNESLPRLCVSAGEKFDENMVTNAIVRSDGDVLWMYPALLATYCTLNVEYFPFDTQDCHIIFISWTFSGFEVNISHSEDFPNAVYYNSANKVTFGCRSAGSSTASVSFGASTLVVAWREGRDVNPWPWPWPWP